MRITPRSSSEWKQSSDDFDKFERSMGRKASVMLTVGIAWMIFLMGAIGTGLFLLGRWTGVW
jgi:hypothetical protein